MYLPQDEKTHPYFVKCGGMQVCVCETEKHVRRNRNQKAIAKMRYGRRVKTRGKKNKAPRVFRANKEYVSRLSDCPNNKQKASDEAVVADGFSRPHTYNHPLYTCMSVCVYIYVLIYTRTRRRVLRIHITRA